ncbi:hypothetical protein [Lactobacillus intestinalis]|nr:hypothetical protein [Lactobacillus intestinalis]UTW41341.1 hypothetical protein KBW87_09580 [Lactobacillus intestinalis]
MKKDKALGYNYYLTPLGDVIFKDKDRTQLILSYQQVIALKLLFKEHND